MKSNLTEQQVALMEQSVSAIAERNIYAQIVNEALKKKSTWQEKAVILSGSFATMFEVCTVLHAAAGSKATPLEMNTDQPEKKKARERH